ncbi:protein PAIR1-like isoform X6 [Panicum virgatum]|uniref:protein PAIR1-like isoform X6 n=1 Tax=Panicum virgatum TaxID=38727 RepID=UPI0019D5D1F4|nr:protein PAIR1-like isoform X6 [Panicum virgatum]
MDSLSVKRSRMQFANIPSSSPYQRKPSFPDVECKPSNTSTAFDVECKLQHLGFSVHKMGMVLDSVQNDVIYINRAMKDATLDSNSIKKKAVVLEKSLQEIGIVRAIRSSESRSAAIEMPDQSCTINKRPLMNPMSKVNENPLANQATEVNGRSLVSTTPIVNERSPLKQTPLVNKRPPMNQTLVATERSQVSKTSVVNQRPLVNQKPLANGRSPMNQKPVPNGRSQRKQNPVASGQLTLSRRTYRKPQKSQIPATKVVPTHSVCPGTEGNLNMDVEQGKEPVCKILNSDYDSEQCVSSMILNTERANVESPSIKETAEESLQILKRARKRTAEKKSIVPVKGAVSETARASDETGSRLSKRNSGRDRRPSVWFHGPDWYR